MTLALGDRPDPWAAGLLDGTVILLNISVLTLARALARRR